MRLTLFLLASCFLLIGGCESTKSTPKETTKPATPVVVIEAEPEPLKEVVEDENVDVYKNLIFNTKLGVSPKRPNWVLFSNGTYIIFPTGTSKEDMHKSALGFLQRFTSETASVRKSPLTKGWIASTPKGVYNYVALNQASSRLATDQELATIGLQNIKKDKADPIIVHINTPK